MNIKYKVLSYNNEDHSMLVRYWTDILSEDELASFFDEYGNIVYNANGYPVRTRTDMNITFYNNPNPSSNDIVNLIQNSAPTLWLSNLEQTKLSNIEYSLANVASFVGVSSNLQIQIPVISNDSQSPQDIIIKNNMEKAAKIAIRYIQTGVYDLGNTESYVIQ